MAVNSDFHGIKSKHGLELHGLDKTGAQHWNLPVPELYRQALARGEGCLADGGALVALTGKHTGRSAKDKFVVQEPSSQGKVWWEGGNTPISPENYKKLLAKMKAFFSDREVFVRDCYVGSDKASRLRVRVITEYAWHSLFVNNLFINVPAAELADFKPDYTVMAAPSLQADPKTDATASGTFIALNFAEKTVLIGSSAYAGEIKKSIFTVMNYLLPLNDTLSMHCSANKGAGGDTALFFGLSGTGKTSLSADPSRGLIGDDEHGWNDDGIFNFEGGCYAKVINLSPEAEPQIFACTRRFGTVMENVVLDPLTAVPDLDDGSVTANTRAGYPLEFISNAVADKKGGHPKNIVMLTCDAFGVLPPIARLSPDQALYHFISGYTAKVSGTEVGVKEPQSTFSTCFGAPFMVHHPSVYAELLKKKMLKHKATCWLVNTGWTGGPYGTGSRISIKYTRAILNSALEGLLDNVQYIKDPVFGFEVPAACNGVPEQLLKPAETWKSKDAYMRQYAELAAMFAKNFEKFSSGCSKEVVAAGPKVPSRI
ncbi:MAG: phosphoenolpyruvate carboxykinase (ATP) [Elusimicrobia bacterium]|nr:phosphoenolpyruvate carboxykinase (ATP) [Elusimicrobiota bacterium]